MDQLVQRWLVQRSLKRLVLAEVHFGDNSIHRERMVFRRLFRTLAKVMKSFGRFLRRKGGKSALPAPGAPAGQNFQEPGSSRATPARILAFGDSLTEGYYNYGCSFHPYAIKLHELLSAAGNPNCKVRQRGVSGELVLVGMQERLQSELAEAAAKGLKFDWVVLLAGINDIGSCLGSTEVFQGLENMYKACHSHGARVLAMTLMEHRESARPSRMETERKMVNGLIRQHCHSNKDVVLCDLDAQLPYLSLTDEQREELFDDGLHLTSKGYDRMAELIFQALKGAA